MDADELEALHSEPWIAGLADRLMQGRFVFPEDWKRLEDWTAGDPSRLETLPLCLRTEPVCLAGASAGGQALAAVPEDLKTPEVCRAAVESGTGQALRFVPEALKTPELCLRAVQLDGSQLASVPENLRTEEVCRAAVSNCGNALQDVPWELRTEKLCLAAAAMNPRALQWTPEAVKTDGFLRRAAKLRTGMLESGHGVIDAVWAEDGGSSPSQRR